MIQIDFFNITNDKRSFLRDLQGNDLFSCQGTFKSDTDIIHPTFIISKAFTDVFTCNYVHVWNPINRYYFVDDIRIVGNYFEIICTVDVLFTYKPQILEKKCLIARYEENIAQRKNLHFHDEKYPILSSEKTTALNVGIVSVSSGYYLTVNGGVQ